MYIFYALLAALTSGITTLFAKKSLNSNSNLITFLRTTIIFLFTVLVVLLFKVEFIKLNYKTLLFLSLSGVFTALLWICYFKALSLSSVNKVTPIDKTSIVLTLILSSIFFNEKITLYKIISIIFMLVGTYLMVGKSNKTEDNKWLFYAILTSIFNSIATIIAKFGIRDIDALYATFIRVAVVFICISLYIIIRKDYKYIKNIKKEDYLYIFLSGISTSLSWLFYFMALKLADASLVFPIEKLSAGFAIIFANIFLKEKMNKNMKIGFCLILLSVLILILNNIDIGFLCVFLGLNNK